MRRSDFRRRPASVLGVGLALSLCLGCGYRLAGTGGTSPIPEHITRVVVVPFENRTKRPEIEQRVTEEVASELSKRGRYQVVSDRSGAEAMLEGAVTSYRTSPVTFGADSRATRVEAVVTLDATLRELSTDTIFWAQSGLVFRGQFEVDETEAFFDESGTALDEIAQGAAGALITAMFEGF